MVLIFRTANSLWKWRNQYGEVLGGLGTGIGDGDRAVICARDNRCVAARQQEQETDWTTLHAADHHAHGGPTHSSRAPPRAAQGPRPKAFLGPGYDRHEIEGIGGEIKTKRLCMVRIGACVPEYEDERRAGSVLTRETSGQLRSWCGWCDRVIPGAKDGDVAAGPRSDDGSSEPELRTAGPSRPNAGPLTKITSPPKTTETLTKTSSPPAKATHPSTKTAGALGKTTGPSTKTSDAGMSKAPG